MDKHDYRIDDDFLQVAEQGNGLHIPDMQPWGRVRTYNTKFNTSDGEYAMIGKEQNTRIMAHGIRWDGNWMLGKRRIHKMGMVMS